MWPAHWIRVVFLRAIRCAIVLCDRRGWRSASNALSQTSACVPRTSRRNVCSDPLVTVLTLPKFVEPVSVLFAVLSRKRFERV